MSHEPFEWQTTRDADEGSGWKAWEVTLTGGEQRERTYGFDERDGVETAAQAVQRALDGEHDADRCFHGSEVGITIEEYRIVVAAEIHPN